MEQIIIILLSMIGSFYCGQAYLMAKARERGIHWLVKGVLSGKVTVKTLVGEFEIERSYEEKFENMRRQQGFSGGLHKTHKGIVEEVQKFLKKRGDRDE